MKVKLKKLLVFVLVFLTIFNFLFTMPVYAAGRDIVLEGADWLLGFADGIIGVLTWVFRLPFIVITIALMGLMTSAAACFGYVSPDGKYGASVDLGLLTPDDIFFNKLLLTDINIFNIDPSMPGAIVGMREQIALWYAVMKLLATAVLLAILVYIAIRMAISTIASEKAQYKEMLVNWASSVGLVFALNYLIVIICKINSALVSVLQTVVTEANIDSPMGTLMGYSLSPSLIVGVSSMVVLVMLIIQTFTFLIYYIKRMLTVAFLIIISPLITITYSIDKLGDGKAQALNSWMKEFFFTIIIQPFHCVIYAAFISMAFGILSNGGNALNSYDTTGLFGLGFEERLIGGILAILCLKFVWDAEKIVKNIFGIKVSESLGDAVASAAIAGTAVSKGLGMAKGAAKGVNKARVRFKGKNGGGSALGNKFKQTRLGSYLEEKKNQRTAYRDARKGDFRMQHAMDITDKAARQKAIREVHESRQREKAERKENRWKAIDQGIKKIPVIRGFAKNLDLTNEEGRHRAFSRYLTTSTSAAAAIYAGGAAYGSSKDASIVGSAFLGYSAATGMKSVMERVLQRKKDSLEDTTRKSHDNQCEITGKGDKGDIKQAVTLSLEADRLARQGDLKPHKIDEARGDAEEHIRKILEDRDGGVQDNHDELVLQMLTTLQDRIYDHTFNMQQFADEFGLRDEDVAEFRNGKAGEFAQKYNMSLLHDDNERFDELAGEEDFHKTVLRALVGDANIGEPQPIKQPQPLPAATPMQVRDQMNDLLAKLGAGTTKDVLEEVKKLLNMSMGDTSGGLELMLQRALSAEPAALSDIEVAGQTIEVSDIKTKIDANKNAAVQAPIAQVVADIMTAKGIDPSNDAAKTEITKLVTEVHNQEIHNILNNNTVVNDLNHAGMALTQTLSTAGSENTVQGRIHEVMTGMRDGGSLTRGQNLGDDRAFELMTLETGNQDGAIDDVIQDIASRTELGIQELERKINDQVTLSQQDVLNEIKRIFGDWDRDGRDDITTPTIQSIVEQIIARNSNIHGDKKKEVREVKSYVTRVVEQNLHRTIISNTPKQPIGS